MLRSDVGGMKTDMHIFRIFSVGLLLILSACAAPRPSVHALADFTPLQSPTQSGPFIILGLSITNTTHTTLPATSDSTSSRPILRVNGDVVTASKNNRAPTVNVDALAPGQSVSTGVGASPELIEQLFGSNFTFQWEYLGVKSEIVRVNVPVKQAWIED
jgi:hypothetical protein